MEPCKVLGYCVLLLCFGVISAASTKRNSRHYRAKEEVNSIIPPSDSFENNKGGEKSKVCEGWWCGHGKECSVGHLGLPECICIKTCPTEKTSSSIICGSDGKRYKSHCELHQTGCLQNKALTIDHTNQCISNQDDDEDEYSGDDMENDGDAPVGHGTMDTSPGHYTTTFTNEKAQNTKGDERESYKKDTSAPGDTPPKKTFESSAPVAASGSSSDWVLEPNPLKIESKIFEGDDEEDDEDDFDDNEDDLDDRIPSSPSLVVNPSSKKQKGSEIKKDEKSSSVPKLCSPQEYEILKDNLLLYSHEKLIGGVQNFKKALEAGNDVSSPKNSEYEHRISKKTQTSSSQKMIKNKKKKQKQQQNSKRKSRDQDPLFAFPQKLYFDEGLGDGPEFSRDYLLSLMFSHFDQNNNGALEYEELYKVGKDPSFRKLASGCSVVDILKFDDADRNSQLNINEFYTAFNKLYSVSVISLDKALEITQTTANVGDNVELRCDVTGSPPMPILWKRYGVDLSSMNQDESIRVFSDGTLFLTKIQLLHAGNYSCQAQRNDKVVQTHILSVRTLPDVKVTPHIVWEKPGEEVTMECRVMGEPFPVVTWLKNDDPLPRELSEKYVVTGDAIRLTVKDIYFSDTGAYMCSAENSAGKRLDISSLVIIDDQTPGVPTNESQFFVFHESGISVYDPTNCRIQHQILAKDIIPGTQEYVCGEQENSCDWGRAIKVSSTYVYVSQPSLDRLLVISVTQMVVVDVVSTDRYPVNLYYVDHLDQVWVECWRSAGDDEMSSGGGGGNGGSGTQKTLQVIRDAKEKKKHHTVHPEPINSHFDLVDALFLPPDQKSSSQFRYGYVSHKNTRGLYKMDLIGLRYTKSIDLTPYNCYPKEVQFSALYGMVVVECHEPVTNRPTGQLVLDGMTDSVIYFKGDRYGRPYLSPDSRKLITVNHNTDGSTTLLLQLVKENGLEFFFDVKTSLNVSDITYFPSQRTHTYDLYASSSNKQDVLFLDLESGKVETVSGVGESLELSPWKNVLRPISSQGLFSKYLATPSADAVFVLNGQSHTVNCQIGGLMKPRLIVWL